MRDYQAILDKYLDPLKHRGWTVGYIGEDAWADRSIQHSMKLENAKGQIGGQTNVEDQLIVIPRPTDLSKLYVGFHEIGHAEDFEARGSKAYQQGSTLSELEYRAEMSAHAKMRAEGLTPDIGDVLNGYFYVGMSFMQDRSDLRTILTGMPPEEVFKFADPVMSFVQDHREEIPLGVVMSEWLREHYPNPEKLLEWRPSWEEGGYSGPGKANDPERVMPMVFAGGLGLVLGEGHV